MAIMLIKSEWSPYLGAMRKEFICDTDEDVPSLPQCCTSSCALVIASGKVQVVNTSGNWVEFGAEANL